MVVARREPSPPGRGRVVVRRPQSHNKLKMAVNSGRGEKKIRMESILVGSSFNKTLKKVLIKHLNMVSRLRV